MNSDRELAEHVVDLLADWAVVRWRHMFGGIGLFRGATMFGLIYGGELYLRASKAELAINPQRAFSYRRGERDIRLPYRIVDAEGLEQPERLQTLAEAASAAASQNHSFTGANA